MRKGARRLLAFAAIYVVASVVATVVVESTGEPSMLIESRISMWRLRPGYSGPSAPHPGSGMASVGEDGFRVVPGSGEPAGARVLTVGDSFTFGWGVSDGETYPAQLQSVLDGRAPGRYAVVNAGYPGCTSYQAGRSLRGWLEGVDPAVVLVMVGRNDARRAPLSDVSAHRILRWKPRLASYVFPLQFLHYRSLQSIAARLGRQPAPRVSFPRFEDELRGMAALCRQRRVEMIVLQHWSTYSAAAIAAELGLRYVPLPAILEREQRRSGETLFLEAHYHPNPRGHAVIARAVGTVILDAPGRSGS